MVRESLKVDLLLLHKRLQNQSRVSSSEWQMNKKTFVTSIGNGTESVGNYTGVARKHDSYERYLAKKKSGHLRRKVGTQPHKYKFNLVPGCTCGGFFIGRV